MVMGRAKVQENTVIPKCNDTFSQDQLMRTSQYYFSISQLLRATTIFFFYVSSFCKIESIDNLFIGIARFLRI
jgi:hypothetical protein